MKALWGIVWGMGILMFAPIFPPVIGGPATQCYNLCQVLLQRGFRPVVLTPHERFSRTKERGVVVYRYPWKYTGTILDRVVRWVVFPFYFTYVVLRERPRILHAHSVSASSFVAGVLAKLYGMPSIIKFAGDWVWETLSTKGIQGDDFTEVYEKSWKGRMLKAVERYGVSLYTRIWVPSNFRRENVRSLMGTDARVVQIPNALALSGGGSTVWDGTAPVVISANRFIPHKRVDMIVRAFATLSRKDARLILIGGGEKAQEEKVRKEIERLNLGERVTCTGILSSTEIYSLFKQATVYVSASLEEGFPNVFIEAMHFGLPIVTTDAGGSRELVEDKVTGYVVPVMSEEQLAKRIQDIVENKEARNRYSEKAYEASRQYDLSVVVDSFIALYEQLTHRV